MFGFSFQVLFCDSSFRGPLGSPDLMYYYLWDTLAIGLCCLRMREKAGVGGLTPL